MMKKTETRQHAVLLHRQTLGRHSWSQYQRSVRALRKWMEERYGALDFEVELNEDCLQVRPGWDASQAFCLLRVTPAALWKSRANQHGRLSIPVTLEGDEKGLAVLFLESAMILLQIHFPDRVTIGSKSDNAFADWQDALYTAMTAAFPGPWTGHNSVAPTD